MKIDLFLSFSQIGALIYAFNQLDPNPKIYNRDHKCARAILDFTFAKVKGKYDKLSQKTSLQRKGKKYKFPLEYFEADKLDFFLSIMASFPMNEYDKNVITYIKGFLNQKLA